ncbi:MAG: hypothetical protein KTR24_16705 [Saprospiraceae bacterium]|nr:hypothetical protein [Saprospiraceae bacterium]
MSRIPYLLILLSTGILGNGLSQNDCQIVTYVEWPEADYTAFSNGDSITFEQQKDRLRVRGLPHRRQHIGILEYRREAKDPVREAQLLIYPTSVNHAGLLTVHRLSKSPDRGGQFFHSTANAHLLGETEVGQEAPISIDLDPAQLAVGQLTLSLRLDTKKSLECTSLESGLGSQLLVTACATSPAWNTFDQPPLGPSLQVQRVPQSNRINMLLSAMPRAGIAQLIFFNRQNDIVRTMPIQISGQQLQLMQLDLGTLQLEHYRTVLRMGAVVVDDELVAH